MRYLLPIIFLLPCTLPAQREALPADTALTWVAIVETLLPADPLQGNDSLADMQVLKLKSEDRGLLDHVPHSLNWHLWEGAERERWQYFADANLTLPLGYDAVLDLIGRPDTIVDFDPETYEEKISIAWDVHCCPSFYPFLKIRRLLTWNHATATFEVVPLAFAPAEHDGTTMFWVKYPDVEQPRRTDLDSPDIHWAVHYKTQASSARIDGFKVLKGAEVPLMNRVFDRLASDTSVVIYVLTDAKPASAEERDDIFRVRTDSVAHFDPETYEEVLRPVSIGHRPEDVVDLRFVEEWVWDKRQKLFFTRLLAVAPRIRTEGGWLRAIFYLPVRRE